MTNPNIFQNNDLKISSSIPPQDHLNLQKRRRYIQKAVLFRFLSTLTIYYLISEWLVASGPNKASWGSSTILTWPQLLHPRTYTLVTPYSVEGRGWEIQHTGEPIIIRLMACNEWHNIHKATIQHSNMPIYKNTWFIASKPRICLFRTCFESNASCWGRPNAYINQLLISEKIFYTAVHVPMANNE